MEKATHMYLLVSSKCKVYMYLLVMIVPSCRYEFSRTFVTAVSLRAKVENLENPLDECRSAVAQPGFSHLKISYTPCFWWRVN